MTDDRKENRKYSYHTVNLPMNLTMKIEEVIQNGKHGYTNVPDFTKEAVRRYLRDLGYIV
jgi:Arc/MetJ-type ribon-helix-helix transcriptional regulator